MKRGQGCFGKVGPWGLELLSEPNGSSGSVFVKVASGEQLEVQWKKDKDGLWIETPYGFHGFDICRQFSDDGSSVFLVLERGKDKICTGLSFVRAGEENLGPIGAKKKKGTLIRAQMPGKIVKLLVDVGAVVEKDQPLLVIEAMKMENQILAPQAGKIIQVSVVEGQAVESGAPLMVVD